MFTTEAANGYVSLLKNVYRRSLIRYRTVVQHLREDSAAHVSLSSYSIVKDPMRTRIPAEAYLTKPANNQYRTRGTASLALK